MLKKNPNKAVNTTLFLIFLVALVLRLFSIKHGFPFIFHPDEPAIIRSALGLRFNKNPGHFDWPHLYINVNYFIYMVFAKLRDIFSSYDLKEFASSLFPLLWNDSIIYYYITRVFSALLGALTVIPIYLSGREFFNKKVGILAALTFAIIPFHVWHSHYSLSDVPMVFLLACGIYFTSRLYRQNDVGHYAKAGFFIGLAASAKYNGGLSAIIVPLAHVFRVFGDENEDFFNFWSIVNLVVSGIFAVAGFLLGTPYALLDYKTFIRKDGPQGALWQFTNVGSVPWFARAPKFFEDMVHKLSSDVGYVILAGFFITFLLLLIRSLRKIHKPENASLWILFISAFFLLAYISGFRNSRSHYYMIAYPYISLVFGYLLFTIFEYFRDKWKFVSYLSLVLILTLPFYYSLEGVMRFSNGDTRNILHTWLQMNLKPEDEIVYENNNINPVLEHTNNSVRKGASYLGVVQQGYLVYSFDDANELADYITFAQPYKNRLTQVFSVSKEYFLGPDILIYKIQ